MKKSKSKYTVRDGMVFLNIEPRRYEITQSLPLLVIDREGSSQEIMLLKYSDFEMRNMDVASNPAKRWMHLDVYGVYCPEGTPEWGEYMVQAGMGAHDDVELQNDIYDTTICINALDRGVCSAKCKHMKERMGKKRCSLYRIPLKHENGKYPRGLMCKSEYGFGPVKRYAPAIMIEHNQKYCYNYKDKCQHLKQIEEDGKETMICTLFKDTPEPFGKYYRRVKECVEYGGSYDDC